MNPLRPACCSLRGNQHSRCWKRRALPKRVACEKPILIVESLGERGHIKCPVCDKTLSKDRMSIGIRMLLE